MSDKAEAEADGTWCTIANEVLSRRSDEFEEIHLGSGIGDVRDRNLPHFSYGGYILVCEPPWPYKALHTKDFSAIRILAFKKPFDFDYDKIDPPKYGIAVAKNLPFCVSGPRPSEKVASWGVVFDLMIDAVKKVIDTANKPSNNAKPFDPWRGRTREAQALLGMHILHCCPIRHWTESLKASCSGSFWHNLFQCTIDIAHNPGASNDFTVCNKLPDSGPWEEGVAIEFTTHSSNKIFDFTHFVEAVFEFTDAYRDAQEE